MAQRPRGGDQALIAAALACELARAFRVAKKRMGANESRWHPKSQSTFSPRVGRQSDFPETGEADCGGYCALICWIEAGLASHDGSGSQPADAVPTPAFLRAAYRSYRWRRDNSTRVSTCSGSEFHQIDELIGAVFRNPVTYKPLQSSQRGIAIKLFPAPWHSERPCVYYWPRVWSICFACNRLPSSC